jgi:hypothetical protein
MPTLQVRSPSAAGWPRRIAPPRLPLIRTCGFPASGSSHHGFAIPGAIRSPCVEMLAGLCVPGIVPPNGSVTRSAPFLRWVARAAIPAFVGTMGDSDSPSVIPLRFGCPSAQQYRRVLRQRRRRWGLLRSWGTSLRSPPSQTPVGPLRLAFEDDYRCGELLFPAAFAFCRCLSPHHRRFLSASRRLSSAGAH